MSNKELTAKYKELIGESDIVLVKDIHQVNYNPHPYMVGPKHITYASNHHSGRLGKETMKAVPCAHPGCKLSYEEHTSDTVLFLQLKRNTINKELSHLLQPLGEGMEEDGIDGLAFVEAEEEFRIS